MRLIVLLLGTALMGLRAPGPDLDHRAAFARLASLEGRWEGPRSAVGDTTRLTYRVASHGTVVMEILNEAGADEMINMYHLVGGELQVHHYCAGGNQPHLRLVEATDRVLRFVLMGGTNVDPARDGHIHEVGVTLRDDGRLDSRWIWYERGRPDHDNTFTVARVSVPSR